MSETSKTKGAFLKAEKFDQAATKSYEAASPSPEIEKGSEDEAAEGDSCLPPSIEWVGPRPGNIGSPVLRVDRLPPASDEPKQTHGDDLLKQQVQILASSDLGHGRGLF